MLATALIAPVQEPCHFKSGRGFAANLGLTPYAHSSGGRQVLLGISKQGERRLRPADPRHAQCPVTTQGKPDRLRGWTLKLKQAKRYNLGAVALANRVALIAWALLAHDRHHPGPMERVTAHRGGTRVVKETGRNCRGEDRQMPNRSDRRRENPLTRLAITGRHPIGNPTCALHCGPRRKAGSSRGGMIHAINSRWRQSIFSLQCGWSP